MNMNALLSMLKEDEGFKSYVYPDSRGYWTIGYGRMVDERLGGGITEEEAEYLLDNDVVRTFQELDSKIPEWRKFSPVCQLVLANMCFNLGISKLLGFHKMLSALRRGDREDAAKEMRDSDWYHQVGGRGPRLVQMVLTDE